MYVGQFDLNKLVFFMNENLLFIFTVLVFLRLCECVCLFLPWELALYTYICLFLCSALSHSLILKLSHICEFKESKYLPCMLHSMIKAFVV